jgi:hypothetical protein
LWEFPLKNIIEFKMNTIKEYSAKLDSKKRITLRGARYNHYKVQVLNDGKILLKPQLLVDSDIVSPKTLKMIEKSINNFKAGIVSKPINLKKYNFNDD